MPLCNVDFYKQNKKSIKKLYQPWERNLNADLLAEVLFVQHDSKPPLQLKVLELNAI